MRSPYKKKYVDDDDDKVTLTILSSACLINTDRLVTSALSGCCDPHSSSGANNSPSLSSVQSQLADEMDKLRSELDQFRLRAGSLTEPTLSRWVIFFPLTFTSKVLPSSHFFSHNFS